MKQRKIKGYQVKRYLTEAVSNFFKLAVCIAFTFPFYWMLITSFKTFDESMLFPPTLWPKEFTFNAVVKVLSELEWGIYLKNTVIIITSIMVLELLVMVPAAYAFAKYKFKGSGLLFALVMGAFVVPGQLKFISIYIMFSKVRLIDSLIPQIVPAIANAGGIFLLRQTFRQVPEEMIESARLDGAGEFKIMRKIMLPMAKSSLATILLTSFIGNWNAYFWPLVMTNSEKYRPITFAIAKLKELEGATNWPIVMAGNMVLVIPTVVVFIVFSKHILNSMKYQGIK